MLGSFVSLGLVVRHANRDGSICKDKNSEVLDVHKLAGSPVRFGFVVGFALGKPRNIHLTKQGWLTP